MAYQLYHYLELVAGALLAGIVLSIVALVICAMTCVSVYWAIAALVLGGATGFFAAAALAVAGRADR
jgi:hypothetical protein